MQQRRARASSQATVSRHHGAPDAARKHPMQPTAAPRMEAVRHAVKLTLDKLAPAPAIVLDRFRHILDANAAHRRTRRHGGRWSV
ncbi:hypothetical protein [Ralstonia pseudosolanacearum]